MSQRFLQRILSHKKIFLESIPPKYLMGLLITICGIFVFTLFWGKGLIQIYRLKEDLQKIKTVNARLQEENIKLTNQMERMRKNKEEVEKIAREELGLVKKGEVIYQFER